MLGCAAAAPLRLYTTAAPVHTALTAAQATVAVQHFRNRGSLIDQRCCHNYSSNSTAAAAAAEAATAAEESGVPRS
jgi:hypothetical protein